MQEIILSLINSFPYLVLKISFLAHIPPLGLKVYKILESDNSNSHLADYVVYNGKTEESEIFKIKNMINAKEPVTLENSFIMVQFDQSGLMEVCSE